jgi:hypothetical protein
MTIQELLAAIKEKGWYHTTYEPYTPKGAWLIEVANETKWLSIEYFVSTDTCSIQLYMTHVSSGYWIVVEKPDAAITATTVEDALKVIETLLAEPKVEAPIEVAPIPPPEPIATETV